MNWAWLEKLLDPYSRVARLYPAALVISPLFLTAVALLPATTIVGTDGFLWLLATAAGLYFTTAVVRSFGKTAEQKLLAAWGGWPSTILLRHRNTHIDPKTKARYHSALAAMSAMAFPSAADEKADPSRADEIYRAATTKLIEARRGPKYRLLHDENAAYGFRRNLYGIRWIGVAVATIAAFAALIAIRLNAFDDLTLRNIAELLHEEPFLSIMFLLDIFCAVLFCVIVRQNFVFQAGCEYAMALFRTLDETK